MRSDLRRNLRIAILVPAALAAAPAVAIGLFTAVRSARADDVPVLNIDPVCHGIAKQASTPGEKGGPDLAFAQCIKSEQAMRARLANEWSTFVAADKANCVSEEKIGPLPSYSDLLTCLEMARDTRKLNTNK